MIFYLTFGDLATWLTLAPLKRLMRETGIEVEFVPMIGSLGNVVTSARPGAEDPLGAYKARRARARNMAAERELERMSEMLHISVDNARRRTEPLMLSMGLLWMNQCNASCFDYLDLAFAKTYKEAGDVESEEAVVSMLKTLGVSTEGFPEFAREKREALTVQSDEILANGILSTPAFSLDGEIFLGREHLPLISWTLGGRKGPPPV
jgi:2-hydroxychromene-2-carboxylate isomerase